MTTNNGLDNKSSPFDVDNIHLAANTINVTNVNGTLDVTSNGTGALNLGTNATNHQTTLGSVSGTSSTTVQSGTGGISNNSSNGIFSIASGTGHISISDDATATVVDIATGAGVKTVSLGTSNGGSQTVINCGTGGLFMGLSNTVHTTHIGSVFGASNTILQSGTGGLDLNSHDGHLDVSTGTGFLTISNDAVATTVAIGTGAAQKTVTLGSPNTTSSTVINCGTGGCSFGTTSNVHDTLIGATNAGSTVTLLGPPGGVFLIGAAGNVVSNLNVVTIDTSTGEIGSQAASGGGATVTAQRFTASGAFTYTPNAGMAYVICELVGGGGGSGGCAATGAGQTSVTAGGSGGAYARFLLTAAQVGASLSGSVGAGGTAGTLTPSAGGNGGNTTLATTAAWTVGGGTGTAIGSAAGTVNIPTSGVAGGTITSGTGTILALVNGGRSSNPVGVFGNYAQGSFGGTSPLGTGGVPVPNTIFTTPGEAGTGYGAGGGGSAQYDDSTGATTEGIAGTAGIAIFTEFS